MSYCINRTVSISSDPFAFSFAFMVDGNEIKKMSDFVLKNS